MKKLLIPFHPYPPGTLFKTSGNGAIYKQHGEESMIKHILPKYGLPTFEPGNYEIETTDIKGTSSGNPTYVCDFEDIKSQVGDKLYDVIMSIDGYIPRILSNTSDMIPISISSHYEQTKDRSPEDTKLLLDFALSSIRGSIFRHLLTFLRNYISIMSTSSYAFIGKIPGITKETLNFPDYKLQSDQYDQFNKIVNIRDYIIRELNVYFSNAYNAYDFKPDCKITISTNVSADHEEKMPNPKSPEYLEYYRTNLPLLIIRVEPHIAGGRQRRRSKPRTKSRTKSRGVLPRAKSRARSKRRAK